MQPSSVLSLPAPAEQGPDVRTERLDLVAELVHRPAREPDLHVRHSERDELSDGLCYLFGLPDDRMLRKLEVRRPYVNGREQRTDLDRLARTEFLAQRKQPRDLLGELAAFHGLGQPPVAAFRCASQ